MHDFDSTRRSWNNATRAHNAHKGDQAAFLKGGGDTLFPEELELLGPLVGKRLVHLQCNAGQDTLCLARRGAHATGVDLSDDAIAFARGLSQGAGIEASFVSAEVIAWLHATAERYDLAFSSYGAVGWLPDLASWARGVHRVLSPGGRFVYVEFHPLVWSIGKDLRLSGDDYFSKAPFIEPVGDYVAASGAGLLAQPSQAGVSGGPAGLAPLTLGVAAKEIPPNDVAATSWQHTLADVVSALLDAGLIVECLREYPYSNGCKVNDVLVIDEGRRWRWPDGAARIPLMFGVSARKAP